MGMTIETLKLTFPKSYKELQKFDSLIDKLSIDEVERTRLKTSARLLAVTVATEVGQASKVLTAIGKLFK